MNTWERLKLILFSTIRKALRVLLPRTEKAKAERQERKKDRKENVES